MKEYNIHLLCNEKIEKLESRIKELEEALKEILEYKGERSGWSADYIDLKDIANKALEGI